MAAYAALVSLMNTMQQIMNHHRLSISFDEKQFESLGEKIGFLLDFVERESSHGGMSREEAENLESQIASAAYAAEDVIESHAADQILAGSTQKSLICLLKLQKVIKDMDTIQEEVMKVKEDWGFKDIQTYSTLTTSSRDLSTAKTTMVGFDDYLFRLMDMLTGSQSNRQVIPIVGMGGIGKTTLARNAFENPLIVQFFELLAWVTISQNYSVREIFLQLLSGLEKDENFKALDQHQLGERLYKHLWGRRYLIILDDCWGIEAWDNIKFSFPDNNNGSRIVVTTRLTDVATHFHSSFLALDFLDDDKSWNLFCEKAFGEEGCPTELEEAGKKIVKNCKGLPLSIVVIGGFLKKSYKLQEYWENVAKDTNSILNSEGDEQCLNILSLSYSHLPPHLKPCFLYMGVFPEDDEICVSQLIKLWIAEGFLKPNEAQSLEEVAEGYLKDLVDWNLILVRRWGSNGKIKTCNIHDLLRALCLRVAEKENFLRVMKLRDARRAINCERRIVIHHGDFHALQSRALTRSLICKGHVSSNFRLLRVLKNKVDERFYRGLVEADFQYVNLRCLDRRYVWPHKLSDEDLRSLYLIPREISLFSNLQTLRMKGCRVQIVAPSAIWEMPQLRNLEVDTLHLPDPPQIDTVDRKVDFVLQNLQTLSRAHNLRLSEEVCKRIPNVKKLRTMYGDLPEGCEASSYYCPHNLGRFHKLESLNFHFSRKPYWRDLLLNMTFPSSLRKLTLFMSELRWKDLSIIGSLPHLEVLKLECDSAVGRKWNPVEGEFLRLKYLKIWACDLIKWNADRFHFPVLENLVLEYMSLDKIPSGMGEIPTLRCIRLNNCRLSCAISALEILAEQQSLGNEDLRLEVQFHVVNEKNLQRFRKKLEQEGFTSKNLKYGFW